MLALPNSGSCVGPENTLGHPAHRYRQLPAECKYAPTHVLLFFVVFFFFFLGLHSEIVNIVLFLV